MIYEVFDLRNKVKGLDKMTMVHAYCPDNHIEHSPNVKRKTVIVIPGGGYDYCSSRENEPLALSLMAHDYNAFCIDYAVKKEIAYPYPLIQVLALVAYIRNNANKYNVDPNNIYVMGFSAGGHLAASAACYHNEKKYADMLNVSLEDIKVNGCILAYPVITMDEEYTHMGTMLNITEGKKQDLIDYFSIEKHVTKDFPKTFIYETEEDQAVPPENTYRLVESLKKAGVEYKLDLYPYGVHGTSTCQKNVYYWYTNEELMKLKPNSRWISNMANFFNGDDLF